MTVTLPVSATRGDEIYVSDVTGKAFTNNITVARNGHKINALAENLVMDVDMCSVRLIYDNTTNGWHIDAGGSYFGGNISSFKDPFITLNSDFTAGTPTENGGIIIKRGGSDDAIIRWNETSNQWELTNDGVTFSKILTEADVSATLDSRYINSAGDTMTGPLIFNPTVPGAPFVIGANATGQLVSGLNAQYSNGIMFTTITSTPSGNVAAGDIWFQVI